MDQKALLTKTRLTLAPKIKAGPQDEEVIPLKNVPYKTYLTISPKQWKVLKRFRTGATVSEVLPKLIMDRECPSLSSLYELILKAYKAGVLIPDEAEAQIEQDSVSAFNWRLQLSEKLLRPFVLASLLFGVIAVFWEGIILPKEMQPILAGWGAAVVALSLGNVLAAALLRWYEVEIYHPHLRWRTLVPHFSFDRSDMVMVTRPCRRLIALARLAPLFLAMGLAAIFWPPMAYILLLGVFYSTDPVTENPATDFVRACYKELRLSTTGDFLFVQNRLFWSLVNRKMKLENKRFYMMYALYTFCWLLLVHTLHSRLFDLQGGELLYLIYSHEHFHVAAITVVAMLLLMTLLAGGAGLWLLLKNVQTLWQTRPKRKVIPVEAKENVDDAKKSDILGSTLLFQKANLEPAVLEAISSRAQVLRFKKNDTIIREGDEGDSLFVVAQGEVEIQKENPCGRPSIMGRLGQLDAFGEIALLRRVPRTRSVVAKTNTILLEISRDDFQHHLVGQVGAEEIEATLEKEAFLARLEFTASWPPQALRRFSEFSTECTVKAGDRFLKKGHDNRFFYLVYEGAFEVKAGDKRLAKLGIGDFFGEISLLQNSIITADVYAIEDSRCFVLYKSDFLQFISEDFVLSLFFERVSSERLHEPIFPLKGRSFDCITAR